MAQITSREELEEWLKDKPADWAQVILVRLAMRDWPNVFDKKMPDSWVQYHSTSLFQALLISWSAINTASLNMRKAIRVASNALQEASRRNYYAPTTHAFLAIMRAFGSEKIYSISGIEYFASTSDWYNASSDCEMLEEYLGTFRSGSYLLTYRELWTAFEPDGWRAAWQSATTRLLTLDPTYQVWIDWYNRRIEGHAAAFDIRGDSDRTEDKKILARLADATNEDFWDKGATHVNTTLQSWIDEAREQAAIDYVASGAPLKLGSDAELAARGELASRLASVEDALAALKDQLASLTQTGHGGIGHNQPENATSLRDDEIITLRQQVASLEILVTGANAALTQPEPDIGELVQLVPKLNRWGRMMQAVEDVTSPKVREGLETWAGPAALGAVGYLASTTIPNALAAFSHYFYTYWIPILIG